MNAIPQAPDNPFRDATQATSAGAPAAKSSMVDLTQAFPQATDNPFRDSAQAQAAQQPEAVAPTNDPSLLSQIGRQFTMAGRNVVHGVMTLPGVINDPIAATLNYGEQKLGIDPKYRFGTASQATDAALNGLGVPNYQPQNATERVVGRIEQGLGGVMGGSALGGVLGGTSNTGAQVVGNALQSNLLPQGVGAATGATLGGVAHEEGASPGAELAWSLAGGLSPAAYEVGAQALPSAAARLFGGVSPETQQLAQSAQRYGIPLKATQLSSSKVAQTLDSTSQQIPFSGGANFNGQQQEAFNRAVGQTIGIDSPKITPDVFNGAVQRIGGEFDRLTANNSIPLTPELMTKLKGVADNASAYYGPESQSMINQTIQRLSDQAQGGVIPGQVYQSVDSSLGKAIRTGGERSAALGDLQDTLRDAMEANLNPEDMQAWQQARAQWRDMRTIEPLVAKSTTGDISPAGLMGRVVANQSGKTAMARGTRGDLGDLARIGQAFVKDPIPDSGTARRLGTMEALKTLGTLSLGADAAHDPMSAALGAAGLLGSARLSQNFIKSPSLINAMLGQGINRPALLNSFGTSLNPATQSVLQNGH